MRRRGLLAGAVAAGVLASLPRALSALSDSDALRFQCGDNWMDVRGSSGEFTEGDVVLDGRPLMLAATADERGNAARMAARIHDAILSSQRGHEYGPYGRTLAEWEASLPRERGVRVARCKGHQHL